MGDMVEHLVPRKMHIWLWISTVNIFAERHFGADCQRKTSSNDNKFANNP